MPKKRKSKILFAPMTQELLTSRAFKELIPAAKMVIPYFLLKSKDGKDVKSRTLHSLPFDFPYGEAQNYGFSRGGFKNGMRQLVKHGFIDLVKCGQRLMTGGKSRNIYRISDRWQRYGRFDFVKRENPTTEGFEE